MKAVFSQDWARRWFGLRFFRGAMIGAVCLALLALALPSFGLWLPWAKEEDKIAKRLNEIWAAVLLQDRKMLGMYVLGEGAPAFIDQEIAHAKSMKIKSYMLRVDKATFDTVSGQFAWVEVSRTATQDDGHTATDRSLKVLKKVEEDWKLIIDIPRDRRKRDKTTAGTAESADKGASAR